MIGLKDTLFVLDNNIYGDGEGVIRIFNIGDDTNNLVITARENLD
jgi:hypothetical protein